MIDLIKITGFDWDDGNARKNEKQQVFAADAEQVFFNAPLLLLANAKHSSIEFQDWSKSQKAVLPNLKPTTKTISLRLPQHLLDSLKAAANARDVPCQSLIKVWLLEKLRSH